jgi:hypothetical protein
LQKLDFIYYFLEKYELFYRSKFILPSFFWSLVEKAEAGNSIKPINLSHLIVLDVENT